MDWAKIPEPKVIDKAMAGLKERGFDPVLVPDGGSALEKLKQMIPAGAEVMTGDSTTLKEIGFINLLKSNKHPWQNWRQRILAEEKDSKKKHDLRRASTTAEYFVGSAEAITESGQVLGADASGSRQSGYVYGAKNVIWVVGVNKIVSDLDMAFQRLYEHCLPLEDARMKKMGIPGAFVGKIVIYEREFFPHRISTILVREKLGA